MPAEERKSWRGSLQACASVCRLAASHSFKWKLTTAKSNCHKLDWGGIEPKRCKQARRWHKLALLEHMFKVSWNWRLWWLHTMTTAVFSPVTARITIAPYSETWHPQSYTIHHVAVSQNCVWNVPRCSGRMEWRGFGIWWNIGYT